MAFAFSVCMASAGSVLDGRHPSLHWRIAFFANGGVCLKFLKLGVYKFRYPRFLPEGLEAQGGEIEQQPESPTGTTHQGPHAPELRRTCGGSAPQQTCAHAGPEVDGDGSGGLRDLRLASLPPVAVADPAPEWAGDHEAAAKSGSCSSATPASVIEARPSAPSPHEGGLTDSELGYLSAVLGHEVARNTMKNYRSQWRIFMVWALRKGITALPADPAHVAAYLAERIERLGHKPATLRTAAAAIAFVHRTAGVDDPCAGQAVRRTLRSATRKAGRLQKQAEALTTEVFAAIRATVGNPRRGRGGIESPEAANSRGNLDVALVSLMRDAMLRVSEAAALTWGDMAAESDGTGRLAIRRSKTDAEGEGAVAFVSVPTMKALGLIREGSLDTESVFGLRANQIAARIKRAAQAAGLGDSFSGHSPRVGMARDLARAGIELPSLMHAGRWRTPGMPAHYIRNETAGRSAVAQFYGSVCRAA